MPRPPLSKTWPVPSGEGRDLDVLSRRLARRIGGAWAWADDAKRYYVWRVQDRVRLELTLERQGEGGALQARLDAEPEYGALRGLLSGVVGALAAAVALLGLLWHKALLVAGLGLLVVAALLFLRARRPDSAEEAASRQQLEAVARVLDEALGQAPTG